MSKKRPLDLKEVERLWGQGLLWREIAERLGWGPSALKERLNKEGWRPPEREPAAKEKAAPKEKRQGLKERLYNQLKSGVSVETLAAAMGKSPTELAKAAKCDLAALMTQARAAAEVELAGAIYERALAGDRQALNQWRRSLA